MSDNSKTGNWTKIIKAVKTPIAYFTLLALIIESTLIFLGKDHIEVVIGGLTLIGLLIIVVGLILWKKPGVFTPKTPFIIGFDFPNIVDLNVDQCTMLVRDNVQKNKYNGKADITDDFGNWVLSLNHPNSPLTVDYSDSIDITLVEMPDDNGNVKKWTTRPFKVNKILKKVKKL